MATIEFDAFVNASHNGKNGETFVLKTAEAHRRKVAGTDDEYETYSRTFRDVFLSNDADKDTADDFGGTIWEEGDRVHVTGQEVTRPREYNGKTYYDLIVWATHVERIATVEHKPAQRKAPARKTAARR